MVLIENVAAGAEVAAAGKVAIKLPSRQPSPLPVSADGEILGPNEILDPLTGEIVDMTDPDSLIDAYERMKSINDRLYFCIMQIRLAAAGLCEGDAKTRRIAGKRRAAKIELPSESWEQGVLKELWNSHPEIAQEYLRIEQIVVKATEYKKLVNTSAPTRPDLEFFRDAMTKACKGRVGTPTLKVEK